MFENVMPGPVSGLEKIRESACIHTRKIIDSSLGKDYVEDLRFYPTEEARDLLAGSQMVKGGTADLLYIYNDMEPVTFKKNALFPWRRALFSGTK